MKQYAEIGEAVTRLIPLRFPSDAAFERAASLPPKTVSNWRRGRSATYMKMLPLLEELLGDELTELLHGVSATADGLTKEEERLLRAWRTTEGLPPEARRSLHTTLVGMIKLSVGGKHK